MPLESVIITTGVLSKPWNPLKALPTELQRKVIATNYQHGGGRNQH